MGREEPSAAASESSTSQEFCAGEDDQARREDESGMHLLNRLLPAVSSLIRQLLEHVPSLEATRHCTRPTTSRTTFCPPLWTSFSIFQS